MSRVRAEFAQRMRRRVPSWTASAFVAFCVTACTREAAAPAAVVVTTDPPAGPPWFVEESAQRGLKFQHRSGADGRCSFPEVVCGGVALFDFDGDGDLDVFCVQAGSLADGAAAPQHALFENHGDGTFTDVSAKSELAGTRYGVGVASGDYDNDGKPDLLVTGVGQDRLLHNEGGGRFSDATAASGIREDDLGVSASFFDADADGDLDLFVANYVHWTAAIEIPCFNTAGERTYCNPRQYPPSAARFWRNRGDGTFDDASDSSGIASARGNGLGVVTADFDGDGRIDVFVANDGTPNHLWLNRGTRFEESAQLLGCAVDRNGATRSGMGVDVADIDGDGDWDLFVGNLQRETDGVYENGGRWFDDRAGQSGLSLVSRQYTRFGLGFRDFDADGELDLYIANGRVTHFDPRNATDALAEPNLLLRGTGAWKFVEVTPVGGTRPPLLATSRGVAFGDVDGDGALDIVVANRDGPVQLLRNVHEPRGHWLQVRALEEHGRDAFGALVSVTPEGRTLRRRIESDGSYASSSDPRAHFGLGPRNTHLDVEITWVGGAREVFEAQPVDGTVVLRRGQGRSRDDSPPRR